MKKNTKNPAISFARTLGMLSIVLCHIILFYSFIPGSSFLGQVFNSGVQLFLFISGYLYGGKIISNFGKWYAKRALTVTFPAITVSILVIIALAVSGHRVEMSSILIYGLNLEGVSFIVRDFSRLYTCIPSIDPLWFTAIIMLCYLTLPLLHRVSIEKTSHHVLFVVVGILVCLALFPVANITYFFFFAIGYFLGKKEFINNIRLKTLVIHTIAVLIAIAGRLVLRNYIDGTNLYMYYAELSRFVIGTWVFTFVSYVYCKAPDLVYNIANSCIVKWLEKYSFYIYLTHCIFCMGVYNVYLALPLWQATIAFFVLTIVSSLVLKWLCDGIVKVISKSKSKAKKA